MQDKDTQDTIDLVGRVLDEMVDEDFGMTAFFKGGPVNGHTQKHVVPARTMIVPIGVEFHVYEWNGDAENVVYEYRGLEPARPFHQVKFPEETNE